MKRLMMAGLGLLALSGCMGSHLKKLPACDGKHRRPANIYGSILPTLPVPLPPSVSGAGVHNSALLPSDSGTATGTNPFAAVPAASPNKTSLLQQPAQFASC